MKNSYKYLSLIGFAFIVTHCASSTVGVAPSNRPLANQPYETVKSVEKVFSWYSFDIAIYGASIGEPPLADIYKDLFQGEEADAIVNIRYFNEKAVYGFISKHRFGIKGDLVRFTGSSPSPPTQKKK